MRGSFISILKLKIMDIKLCAQILSERRCAAQCICSPPGVPGDEGISTDVVTSSSSADYIKSLDSVALIDLALSLQSERVQVREDLCIIISV